MATPRCEHGRLLLFTNREISGKMDTFRGSNSVVRVPAFQAGCRGFESRLPLHISLIAVKVKRLAAEKMGS